MNRKYRIHAFLMCFLFVFLFSTNGSADSFDDHLAFRRMKKGDCQALYGTVTMRIVYVDTENDRWTSVDQAAWRETAKEAVGALNSEAQRYGINIRLHIQEFHVTADSEAVTDYDAFVMHCVTENGNLHDDIFMREEDQNVFTIFCFRNERRALAYPDREGVLSEGIVVGSDATIVALAHEILHLFGAADLYFPAQFERAARKYFPDSIMLSTDKSVYIDSLTAYCIGWTHTLDNTAIMFLQETSHVTQDELDRAYDEELYTGYAVRRDTSSVRYGYMVEGVLDGSGIQRWENGDWYAGEFKNGVRHGNGTYYWANGTVYTGDFLNGQRTGEGSIIWSDGTSYVGTFDNGNVTGQGMYVWPDGARYVGELVDGQYHGYGTYTDANGNILQGQWYMGEYVK